MNPAEQIELEGPSLEKILLLIHKLTGISMGTNKKTLIQGRLRPRMRTLGIENYEKYFEYLNSTKDEVQEFINLITTNETSFFRTQRVWEYFNNEFLPAWYAINGKKQLRIWSGASSSGEEVYTIGICCEEFKLKNPSFSYQIFGSDISTEMVSTAEKGEYSGRSIETFKNTRKLLFDKYMQAKGESFVVTNEIKSKIRFGLHNLFFLPKEKNCYDIVFLRNVLIYFEPADIEKVLSNISLGLVAKGTLIIGESESLSSLKTTFKYKLPLVYEKVEDSIGN